MKILIIEDDHDIVALVELHLRDIGAEVDKAYDGLKGLELGSTSSYDLIILDLMLPSLSGLEVCRRLRALAVETPILMLTAKSEEIDKVLGLESGADDYLTKPFGIRELLARVNAILRRTKAQARTQKEAVMTKGDLRIDVDKMKVSLNGQRIELSKKEFELLSLMASNPGKSYSRSQLLKQIWGYDFDGYEHTVNSHINRLRSKIEADQKSPQYILTAWGIGYRFNEDL